ncbi:MAG: hypothetical protein RIR00_85 [Pseudomonadota bacterium]|jgi:tetratricopeptide (TPR) repeat protein
MVPDCPETAPFHLMEAPDNEAMLHALRSKVQKKRVLLVDRHPQARDALRMMLSTIGVALVHGAGNTAEVLRQVKGNDFDIILADYILDDGRDGHQLLEELRHRKLISLATVYLVVTSERAYRNVVSLAELAPDDYLIRPFTAEQLQNRLVRAVYKKHVLRHVYRHIENGSFQEALAACERIAQHHRHYLFDALRFKAELLAVMGRSDEAEAIYRQVLEQKVVPWAKMGLAASLRQRGALEEASTLASELTRENPEFLAAHDLLAAIQQALGDLHAAQGTLQQAAILSPHNTQRLRQVGDLAQQNEDYIAAERAFAKVLQRHRSSSLRSLEDYANLSRIYAEQDNTAGLHNLVRDLRKEFRQQPQGEVAALLLEALCQVREGDETKAGASLKRALALRQQLKDQPSHDEAENTPRLNVDLAHACMVCGLQDEGLQLLREVAAEHNEDPTVIRHIEQVFQRTGQEANGQALLKEVGAEIVSLNNRGVIAARDGDLQASVQLLIQAAEKMPNLQFLCNAAKAIFTLMEQEGWDEALAEKAIGFLQKARAKDDRNPRVSSTRELYAKVAKRFGIAVVN